jgi:hypothetical protein
MSDNAEAVALRLLEILMQHEQLAAEFKEKPGPAARNWLLNSYGECLRTVLGGKERAEGRLGKGRGKGRDTDESAQGRPRRGATPDPSED